MSLSKEQRSRLARAKLTALVRDLDAPIGEPIDVGSSVGLVASGSAAVLIDRGDAGALSGAMLWARRREAERLVVFVDDAAEDVARWAGYFELPAREVGSDDLGGSIEVRAVDGATSHTAVPSAVPTPPDAPEVPDDCARILADAGVEVVSEWGVVRAEVLGLEVARLVVWPVEVGGDGLLHIETGVGRFDRDAVAATRGDQHPAESLARTLEQVRAHRYGGAPAHPVQVLARERWLRTTVVDDPALVGAAMLQPMAMTTEAAGIKDPHPAAARGTDPSGRAVVVVCSTGVDLALVPLAADTLAMHDPTARLVLGVPHVDIHIATTTLVDMLRGDAELIGLAPGWG